VAASAVNTTVDGTRITIGTVQWLMGAAPGEGVTQIDGTQIIVITRRRMTDRAGPSASVTHFYAITGIGV
tara:strand:+ start:1746 stop:1955 length:210 start_codon:yes stop_codon:yes gene_type:complete